MEFQKQIVSIEVSAVDAELLLRILLSYETTGASSDLSRRLAIATGKAIGEDVETALKDFDFWNQVEKQG